MSIEKINGNPRSDEVLIEGDPTTILDNLQRFAQQQGKVAVLGEDGIVTLEDLRPIDNTPPVSQGERRIAVTYTREVVFNGPIPNELALATIDRAFAGPNNSSEHDNYVPDTHRGGGNLVVADTMGDLPPVDKRTRPEINKPKGPFVKVAIGLGIAVVSALAFKFGLEASYNGIRGNEEGLNILQIAQDHGIGAGGQ